MGKRKWRRVRLADLASAEEQTRLLRMLQGLKEPPAPETAPDSEKRPPESPATER